MKAFVDSSVLVAIALEEPRAAELRERLDRLGKVYATNLLEAELRSTAQRENLDSARLDALLSGVSWVVPSRPLSPEFNHILAHGHLRGADLWHVACALYVGDAAADAVPYPGRPAARDRGSSGARGRRRLTRAVDAGWPRGLPPRGSHRSGLARFAHPARQTEGFTG